MKVLSYFLGIISIVGFLLIIYLLILSYNIDITHCTTCQNLICNLFGAKEKIQVIGFLGWMAAGEISLVLAWSASARASALNKTAEAHHETAKAHHGAVKESMLSRLSLYRKRHIEGLSLLGNVEASVRIWGAMDIFLGSLQPDMEEYRTRTAITLCAHIREKTISPSYQEKYRYQPSSEVSEILSFLFVKGGGQKDNVNKFWAMDRADLSGSYLAGCNLEGANFKEAQLDKVCFNFANLQQARFYGASLKQSEFLRASLKGATFMGAEMAEAHFWWANLTEAHFQGSSLHHAGFIFCDLDDTEFMGAEVPLARFLEKDDAKKIQRWYFRGASGDANQINISPTDLRVRLQRGLGTERSKLTLESIMLRPGGFSKKHINSMLKKNEDFMNFYHWWTPEILEERTGEFCDFLMKNYTGVQKDFYGIKPDEKWEKRKPEEKYYSEKDIEEWMKDYEENRTPQLLSPGKKQSPDSITNQHPICPCPSSSST